MHASHALVIALTSILATVGVSLAAEDGLVSSWPAEGNANDLRDGNHGTMQNGATFAPGKVGQAFSLDGVDDFVEIPNSANLAIAGQISVLAWIKTSGSPNYAGILSKTGPGPAYAGYEFFMNPTGQARFDILWIHNQGIGAIGTIGGPNLEDGQWHHVAGTFDGSISKLYVDGVLVASQNYSGNIGTSSSAVVIGNSDDAAGRFFSGLIDEVKIYNRALSAAEIQVTVITPAQAITSLLSTVGSLGLPNSVSNVLENHLTQALSALNDGNPNTNPCIHLNNFIQQVNLKSTTPPNSPPLSMADANTLLAMANAIKSNLSCP